MFVNPYIHKSVSMSLRGCKLGAQVSSNYYIIMYISVMLSYYDNLAINVHHCV